MSETIFDKLINGELPVSKIYEDEKTLAFLDIAPFEKGHTVVIPKKRYKTIMDIPSEELCDLILVVQKIAQHFEEELNCGISIWQNNHALGEQWIPHIHFHIIPRLDKTKKYDKMEDRDKYLNGEIENYVKRLKLEVQKW